MILIVGLGNPGAEHIHTRHNVAWMLLEHFAAQNGMPTFIESAKVSGRISQGVYKGSEVTLLLPTTFMNNSGTAVLKYMKQATATEIVVVHDDVDLPIGSVRISYDRGAGGHNGVQSIIETIGSKKFVRVRIGVAPKSILGITKRPKGNKMSDFVLGTFTKRETKILETVVYGKTEEALMCIVEEGVPIAMNKCNSDA